MFTHVVYLLMALSHNTSQYLCQIIFPSQTLFTFGHYTDYLWNRLFEVAAPLTPQKKGVHCIAYSLINSDYYFSYVLLSKMQHNSSVTFSYQTLQLCELRLKGQSYNHYLTQFTIVLTPLHPHSVMLRK